jgi:hypothetical protein
LFLGEWMTRHMERKGDASNGPMMLLPSGSKGPNIAA